MKTRYIVVYNLLFGNEYKITQLNFDFSALGVSPILKTLCYFDKMMDNNLTMGTKLLIALVGGEIYEGVLYSANEDYISLYNVSEYPAIAKTDDMTQLQFYMTELSAVVVIQKEDEPVHTCVPVVPLYYEQFEQLKQLSHKYIYISMVDDRYHAAMKHLNTCDVIAVFGVGCNTGRCDTAVLISVATKTNVYIFDNLISNKRVIEMGFNDILESEKIVKVFHNCSTFSDCLRHVYKINVENVFDTQVADVMICAEGESLPREIRKFSELVQVYLKLPAGVIENNDITSCTRAQLQKRPLTDDMKLNLALQTVYLYYLKPILERQMLEGFYSEVDACLNVRYENNPESIDNI